MDKSSISCSGDGLGICDVVVCILGVLLLLLLLLSAVVSSLGFRQQHWMASSAVTVAEQPSLEWVCLPT